VKGVTGDAAIPLQDLQAKSLEPWGRGRRLALRWRDGFLNIGLARDVASDFLHELDGASSKLATSSSPAGELEKLNKLRQDGALSDDDWQRAKSLYLGKPPDKQQETFELLRNLHQLHKAGALSESEFNLKKWDVLSRP
ncbi:MAG: SHOCT domain-containing protein, partial [Acidimicrobiia bacterium]